MGTAIGNKVPLSEAELIALVLIKMLAPACEKIEIVGSVRRRRETVNDLELLAVPIVEPALDLFGEPRADAPPLNYFDALCGELRAAGVFEDRLDKNDRAAFGSRYKRLSYQGVALDLFSVLPPASHGCLTAIRTGPRRLSKALVVARNRTVYDDDGRPLCAGLMPPFLHHKDGRYIRLDDGEEFATPTERDVFALLDIPWLEPWERDDWMAARMAAGTR